MSIESDFRDLILMLKLDRNRDAILTEESRQDLFDRVDEMYDAHFGFQSASNKPILCLDFDGVCHSYTSGWKGPDVIPDAPVPGVFDFLVEAIKAFEVHIYSSRSGLAGGRAAMKNWFVKHETDWMQSAQHVGLRITPALIFPDKKPPAKISIDDRCLTFNGNWADFDIERLQNFRPWNQ